MPRLEHRGGHEATGFSGVLGGAVGAAWPVAIYAQEADRKYRLGLLVPAPRQSPAIAAFFDELRANGFAEGQNLIVSFGGFDVRNEQISEGVKAVIASSPDAIVGGPELYARALQAETKTIPILSMSEDLVGAGLAASLCSPWGRRNRHQPSLA